MCNSAVISESTERAFITACSQIASPVRISLFKLAAVCWPSSFVPSCVLKQFNAETGNSHHSHTRRIGLACAGSSAWRRREELRKEEHGNRGRWVFAETVKLSEAQALLPAHHPELDDPYARGLPQDCLTYEERYQKYRTPSDEL